MIKNKGFSLLEVMVAVVVVGIGLLGIAKLQITALQNSSHAGYRSNATDMASSIAERIKANIAADNFYVSAPIGACPAMPTRCAMPPDGSVGDASNCIYDEDAATNDMATYDLWEIRCLNGVKNILPEGTMSIACTDSDTTDTDVCTPNSTFLTTITWTNQNGNNEEVVMSFVPGAPAQ